LESVKEELLRENLESPLKHKEDIDNLFLKDYDSLTSPIDDNLKSEQFFSDSEDLGKLFENDKDIDDEIVEGK
jgi:hypothetical protein